MLPRRGLTRDWIEDDMLRWPCVGEAAGGDFAFCSSDWMLRIRDMTAIALRGRYPVACAVSRGAGELGAAAATGLSGTVAVGDRKLRETRAKSDTDGRTTLFMELARDGETLPGATAL
jgi:hypothetical protein